MVLFKFNGDIQYNLFSVKNVYGIKLYHLLKVHFYNFIT